MLTFVGEFISVVARREIVATLRSKGLRFWRTNRVTAESQEKSTLLKKIHFLKKADDPRLEERDLIFLCVKCIYLIK